MNRLLRIALVLVVVAAVGGLATRDVRAQFRQQFAVLDACRTSPAGATVAWNAGNGQFHAESPDAAYATGQCGRWVVDVDAGPFTVTPHQGYTERFTLRAYPVVPHNGMAVALDQPQCESLVVDAIFYRAGSDGVQARVGASRATAVWQVTNGAGACILPRAESAQFIGSTTGTLRYRVAASARLQGVPVKVNTNGVRGLNP